MLPLPPRQLHRQGRTRRPRPFTLGPDAPACPKPPPAHAGGPAPTPRYVRPPNLLLEALPFPHAPRPPRTPAPRPAPRQQQRPGPAGGAAGPRRVRRRGGKGRPRPHSLMRASSVSGSMAETRARPPAGSSAGQGRAAAHPPGPAPPSHRERTEPSRAPLRQPHHRAPEVRRRRAPPRSQRAPCRSALPIHHRVHRAGERKARDGEGSGRPPGEGQRERGKPERRKTAALRKPALPGRTLVLAGESTSGTRTRHFRLAVGGSRVSFKRTRARQLRRMRGARPPGPEGRGAAAPATAGPGAAPRAFAAAGAASRGGRLGGLGE